MDAGGLVPESIHEYNWGSFDPRIGCNRLVCSACNSGVRHRVEPGQSGRLYACRCLNHVQFGSLELESPFVEQDLRVQSKWSCAGHPKFKVPGEVLGVPIDSSTDIPSLVRSALAGELPQNGPVPGFSAVRLYMLLKDAGLGEPVSRSVGGYLTDSDPNIRRGALEFFFDRPTAEGAEQIALVYSRHRDLFEGHPDPTNSRYDLDEHLLRALERRVSMVGDSAAIEAARRDLLGGTRRPALIQALAEVDPKWTLESAGDIIQANPGILKKWLYAVSQLPNADIIAALHAVIARGLASAEDIGVMIDAVFRSEPARGAEIARALGRT